MGVFMRRLLLPIALVMPLFLLVGCGSKAPDAPKVSARGKILVKGQPWKMKAEENIAMLKGTKAPPGAPPGAGGPGGGGGVQITFSPVGSFPGADAVMGKIDPNTGTFDIPAISPGKYKISLGIAGQMGGGDPFDGKFAPNVSKIEREVDGKSEIVIDISKLTG
jgi:hypothetical protein